MIPVRTANVSETLLRLRQTRHADPRVRKEALRALANTGSSRVLPHAKQSLQDDDPAVRTAALRVFRSIEGSDVAMRIVLDEIRSKAFHKKTYSEKLEFFKTLPVWQNDEVVSFLLKTLRRKSLFRRSENDELRAGAAFALGRMEDARKYIQDLEAAASSGGRTLAGAARDAISHIKTHG